MILALPVKNRARCRGGGGGAVRVLRHLLEPDQLPDRPARPDHGGGGGGRQRVVGRRGHAAPARRRRRRLLARPLPHHRRLFRALHHGQRPLLFLLDLTISPNFSLYLPRAEPLFFRHILLVPISSRASVFAVMSSLTCPRSYETERPQYRNSSQEAHGRNKAA